MAEDLSDRLVREVAQVRAIRAKQTGASKGAGAAGSEPTARATEPAKPRSRRRASSAVEREVTPPADGEAVEQPAARPRTRRPPLAVWPD